MERIKSGSIFEIAMVLRELYSLRMWKELSFGERKMFETARNLIKEGVVNSPAQERRRYSYRHREHIRESSKRLGSLGHHIVQLVLIAVTAVTGYFIVNEISPNPLYDLIGVASGLVLGYLVIKLEEKLKEIPLKIIIGTLVGVTIGLFVTNLFISKLLLTHAKGRAHHPADLHIALRDHGVSGLPHRGEEKPYHRFVQAAPLREYRGRARATRSSTRA